MQVKAIIEAALRALAVAENEALALVTRVLNEYGSDYCVIWSDFETGELREPAFWSIDSGWGPLAKATVFAAQETQTFKTPPSAGGDPRWVGVATALQGLTYWKEEAKLEAAPPDWHRHGLWVAVDSDGTPVLESIATTAYSARAEYLRARNRLWSKAVQDGAFVQELVLSGPKMQ